MIRELETERLVLQPLCLEDAQQTQILFPHWEIVRLLASHVPWPYPADGALTHYRDVLLPAMAREEQWHWSIRLKTHPEQLIGSIGLIAHKDDNRGFWLGLPWQGRGLMTEASEIVNEFWFDTLNFPVLRAPKAITNTASRRISEKNGMRVVAREERDYVSGRLPTEIWEITSDAWRAHRNSLRRASTPSTPA